MLSERPSRFRGDGRGQASTIGVVLLLGIAIGGVTLIVTMGSVAVSDVQHQMEVGSAAHAMTEFDSQSSLVAHGSSGVQRASLPAGRNSDVTVHEGDARMKVKVINRTTGNVQLVVVNTTLGSVVYENGDTTIAYQGGGVWERSPGGSRMISPPEFHYKEQTLTLPLVVVNGSGSLDGEAVVRADGPSIARFPDSDAGRVNPMQAGEIEATVTSDYYRAWGRFFEQRTGGTVTYDPDNESVTIEFAVPSHAPGVGGGIVSGAAAETLTLENKASVDSYNSSQGDFGATATDHTDIIAAGSVDLENQAEVKGDLFVGGSVTMHHKSHVTGNVSYGGTLTPPNDPPIDGWWANNASISTPDAVDWLIDQKHAKLGDASGNDNSGAAAIDNSTDTLQNCASTCELSSGGYYLSEIALETGDELVLNTTSGDIQIAVDGGIDLDGDATVRVVGSNTARLYTRGSLDLENSARTVVSGDRSPGLWVYLNPSASATFHNTAEFVGVVYGPGGPGRTGADVSIRNQAKVFGGVVGYVSSVPNGVGVHFDEALTRTNPLAGAAGTAPRVTYLHVSLNPVRVTAD